MKRFGLGSFAALLLCGCGSRAQPRASFNELAQEFVYTTLSFSPAAATQAGYHLHGGVQLDAQLDDLSPAALERQRRWLQDFRLRLDRAVRPSELSAQDRADFDIVQDQISLSLLELNTIQNYRHNPTAYVELAGNALYSVFVLEYADKPTRYQHLIGRLRGVPRLLDQARRNLQSSPEIWTQVAVEENEGTVALIEVTMREACPQALRASYDSAAKPAIAALREFSDWLKRDLSRRTYPWRLGPDNYGQKFRFTIATDQSPQQILRSAEEELGRVRRQMYSIALPLYDRLVGQNRTDQSGVIRTVLADVAKRHAAPETYFADARRDLQEAREFVKAKDLLTLPARDNLQVIETPEFMRGIYSVGGFNAAPALEPQLGAFYWITPLPAFWSKERIESKLREYNFYGLKLLTIHEAMPGHYVQLEYANDVQPPLRRILRAVFGNGAYVEGWAVYATEMMLDEGYLNGSPELRLTFLKQQLRVMANAIFDVRLQTQGMTDQQALDLMTNDAFQEKEEATGKLQRAKLSSTQLPTYFVGRRDWRRLRDRYQNGEGASFSLKTFHEEALRQGAVPLPVLSELLTGKPL